MYAQIRETLNRWFFSRECQYYGFWGKPGSKTSFEQSATIDHNLEKNQKERIINYLSQSPLVCGAYGIVACQRCEKKFKGPNIHSDGVWVWPGTLMHYVQEHDVSLPKDFLKHIVRSAYKPPAKLDVHTQKRLLNKLMCNS